MNARKWFLRILIVIALIPCMAWLFLFWRIFAYSFFDDTGRAHAIVVLGDDTKDGAPSSLYQARLDRAAELYREGYAPLLFVTGETETERAETDAEVGARYLRKIGIPGESVVSAPYGENMFRAIQWADYEVRQYTDEADTSLFVSHDFHNLRIITTARDIGMPVIVSPVKTKNPFVKLYRTFVESFAYLAHIIQVS